MEFPAPTLVLPVCIGCATRGPPSTAAEFMMAQSPTKTDSLEQIARSSAMCTTEDAPDEHVFVHLLDHEQSI